MSTQAPWLATPQLFDHGFDSTAPVFGLNGINSLVGNHAHCDEVANDQQKHKADEERNEPPHPVEPLVEITHHHVFILVSAGLRG